MRTLLLIAFALVHVSLKAQPKEGQAKMDSLMKELRNSRADTNRVSILNQLGHSDAEVRDRLRWYHEALVLAQQLKFETKVPAIQYNLGQVYNSIGEYATAIEYLLHSHDGYLRRGEPSLQADALGSIADVHFATGNLEKAEEYGHKAYTLALESKNERTIAQNELSLGEIYLKKEHWETAVTMLRSCSDRFASLGTWPNVVGAKMNIGVAYGKQGGHEPAYRSFLEALEVARAELDSSHFADLFIDLYLNIAVARERIEPGAHEELRQLFHKALSLAQRNARSHDIAYAHNQLSIIEANTGDSAKAYLHLLKQVNIKDSLDKADQKGRVDKIMLSREQSLREQEKAALETELDLMQEQRPLYYGIILSSLLFSVAAFFQYRRIRKEKGRSDQLLHNILPAHTAKELKTTGTTEPRHYDNVTILFTDFKDFTQVLQGLSPRETVKVIDHYFSAFDDLVQKHGLEKIKTIGDAYMCVSGIPDEKPDHALRAVRAAKEMLSFVEAEASKRQAQRQPWFRIRIGLHTGPVVAGVVGKTKFAYDVWGDTVNTAARLEQHGEADRINISRTTFEYVKHRFPCVPKGYITVKHWVELELYQVEEVGELVV